MNLTVQFQCKHAIGDEVLTLPDQMMPKSLRLVDLVKPRGEALV